VRYEAIGSKLFVSVAEIGRVYSLDPQDVNKGWMSEIDVTVWIMARVAGTLAIRWIPLWLFVDNPHAVATGREVYGFPKQGGQFVFDPPDRENRRFAASTLIIPHFSPETQMVWGPVITLEPSPAPPQPEAAGVWTELRSFAANLSARLSAVVSGLDAQMLSAVDNALSLGKSTLVFLKQFSDVADPRRACYQAIIEADCEVNTIRKLGFTASPYRATILSYDSHPFLDVLGVSPQPQEVGHGIVVDFDFTLTLGQEVWKA
jgi:hypothetical protein